MALPEEIQTVTIVGQRAHPDGTPMQGAIRLVPTAGRLAHADTGLIVQGLAEEPYDTATGDFTITVVASDADGINPTGGTYQLTLTAYDAKTITFPVLLPKAAPEVKLAAIMPVDAADGDIVIVTGPAGADGEPGPQGELGLPGSEAEAQAYTDAAVTAEAERSDAAYTPAAAITVANLLSTLPAFFGHRGKGMVAPEHTMAAYRGAVAAGAKAIEVSVNLAADGTLLCLHDLTLDRTTYSTGALSTWTGPELRNRVLTNGRVLHGQGWTDQPIPTLREVLDEFLGRVVIFLEPKGNDAVVPVQTMLTTFYPNAHQSVVWKAHIGTLSLPWAKDQGYQTWVYLDEGTSDATIAAKDQDIDYYGVPTTMSDARITQIVDRGKHVFSWPVYRRSQRDRLAALGVVGFMTSDIQYVSRATAMRTASRWDNQVKEPGGTPTLDYSADYALKYEDAPDVGWVSINALPNQSYGLGTYSPAEGSVAGYRIAFDMKYKVPPSSTLHGGYYFGKVSDDVYRFSNPNETGGYHLAVRGSGDMELFRHTAGVTSGTRISTIVDTDAPVADTPMSFEIDVTPTTVEVRRTDGTGWTTGPIADTTYRGGYHGLSNGSVNDLATRPFWRDLDITQL